MTTYLAPIEDMMFLFEHLKDNKNYNEIEKFNESLNEVNKQVEYNDYNKLNDLLVEKMEIWEQNQDEISNVSKEIQSL